jgi:hypothetical protein
MGMGDGGRDDSKMHKNLCPSSLIPGSITSHSHKNMPD